MDVSVKGEYALRAVFDLAGRAGAGPVKIAEIAARQEIPQKFLELILAQLKQGGFLGSRRGAEGGYFLAEGSRSDYRGRDPAPHRGALRSGTALTGQGPSRGTPLFLNCGVRWNELYPVSLIRPVSRTSSLAGKKKSSSQAANWQI